jgi:hypothetical protein
MLSLFVFQIVLSLKAFYLLSRKHMLQSLLAIQQFIYICKDDTNQTSQLEIERLMWIKL